MGADEPGSPCHNRASPRHPWALFLIVPCRATPSTPIRAIRCSRSVASGGTLQTTHEQSALTLANDPPPVNRSGEKSPPWVGSLTPPGALVTAPVTPDRRPIACAPPARSQLVR